MSPTIRTAVLADRSAILALEQQAASAAHWSANEYERLVTTGLVLVAEQGGRILGFVCAAIGNEWEIENVVVDSGFLRQGIADQLMRVLLEHSEKAAASRILLEVRESNQAARRLYEKHGFQEAGSRRNYYNNPLEDAILYERHCEPENATLKFARQSRSG
jgi:[ribosomal protein S18]-alanine N-acetyltransferase